ncbi:hypothetical protein OAG24_00085 [bacterium]|nr:hypothetical protein [bacterium]
MNCCDRNPWFYYKPPQWVTNVPCGYQNQRYNPGGKNFSMYTYFAQTQNGRPLSHPGKGWESYEKTGFFKN